MNLVLAHGFVGFHRRFGMDYFNGVAECLVTKYRSLPLRVLTAEVDPIARVSRRGGQLAKQILQTLAAGQLDPNEKVHIIGHSMGGLDARFCVSPGNPENIAARVASVSTISTPHRGSPLADVGTGGGHIPEKLLTQKLDPILELGLGVVDLTTKGAAEFNRQYPDHPQVHYFSYAGRGRDGARPTAMLMLPGYWIIQHKGATANDGLVSIESAAWGERPEPLWPADHADEIGHDLNRIGNARPAFDYMARYMAMVERLKQLGPKA